MKSKIIKAAFLSFVVTNICTLSACSQNDVPQPNGSRVAVNFSSSASQLESSYAAARPDLIDGRQHSVFDDKKAADNKPVKTAAKAKKDKKAAADDSALASKLSSLGSAAQSYSDAVDKTDYLMSIAANTASGYVSNAVNEALSDYAGANAQLSLTLDNDGRLRPSGKVLLPLWSTPLNSIYTQMGITESYNNNKIGHVALGTRFYPFAEDDSSGDLMLGLNGIYHYSLDRHHRSMSIGGEMMTPYMRISSNVYQRLSSWKISEDFDGYNYGYVRERPANGFDIRTKWFFPGLNNLAVLANVEKWRGDHVAPFGDIDELEKNPWVYSGGVEWQPVPAITLTAQHQQTGRGQTNEQVMVNFNVPLGEVKDAFDPSQVNKAGGMDVSTSRSMFIDANFNQILDYSGMPGKWHIQYCGALGDDRHCFFVNNGLNETSKGIPVSVTPHDKCVIMDQGGKYTTDQSGRITATVIESCKPQTTVSVDAGNDSADFPITIEKLNFRIHASPSTIERHEQSTVTLTYDSSNPKWAAGIKVDWKLKDPSLGTLENVQNQTDANGNASVIFKPNGQILNPYEAVLVATVNGVEYEQTIKVAIYGNGSDDLQASPSDIDGGEFSEVTYDNLKPGTELQWKVEGPCTLSIKNPRARSGFDDAPGAPTVTKVDGSGTSTIYVIGNTADGSTGQCKVWTRTEDPYFNEQAPSVTITTHVYDAKWQIPAEVQYGEPFVVTLYGLKDGTPVEFFAKNDSAAEGKIRLVRTLQGVAQGGQARAEFITTGNYTKLTVTGIAARYYHDAKDTQRETTAGDMPIKQYTPLFVVDGDAQAKLDMFSGRDSVTVKLTGGQPGHAITWHPSSNITIKGDPTYDANGEAYVTITGNNIKSAETFTLTAESMGKTADLSAIAGTLQYHVWEPKAPTLPSFKGQSSHLDQKTSYDVTFEGLYPNTPVTITTPSGVTLADGNDYVADSNGKVTVTINPITDFNVKDATLTVEYQQNSAEDSTVTKKFPLSVHTWTLSMTTNKSSIVGDETFVATVTGGRPGATVTWTVSGDGTITQKSATFDSSGKATATVKGKDPYKNTINLTASGSGAKASKTAKIQQYPTPTEPMVRNTHSVGGRNCDISKAKIETLQEFPAGTQIRAYLGSLDLSYIVDNSDSGWVTVTGIGTYAENPYALVGPYKNKPFQYVTELRYPNGQLYRWTGYGWGGSGTSWPGCHGSTPMDPDF